MKITFLVPTFRGLAGGIRMICQHAQYLHDQGHEVTLVSRKPAPLGLRERLRRWRRGNGESTPGKGYFDHVPMQKRLLSPGPGPIKSNELPDGDILVATWWETVEWAKDLPPCKGRLVHFIQDHEVFPQLPLDRVSAVYRQPTYKITVARWLSDEMRRSYDQPAHTVLNGVDIAHFTAPARQKGITPTAGFLYSYEPRKNVDLAFEALMRAKHRLPDLKVIGFGSHPLRHEIPDWFEIHRMPPQSEIPSLYARCDMWLFPSLTEGFGLPLLEAMACGTPVLATRAGAAEDLVIPGQTGQLLPAEPDVFADAIVDMAQSSATDWADYSKACRIMAETHSAKGSSERFTALLSALAQNDA
jgi:glycosyltransferase involved in cell wall biosynthesis